MDLKETPVKKNYVFKGHVVNVRTDEAQLPDGRIVYREVVEHPGGVAIAMEDGEGKFFLVSQWRYGQGRVIKEFPAGKKEIGEDPLTTAKREIMEETGYEGEGFVHLGQMVPTGAYDSELIDLYYAKQGRLVGQHLDADENLRLSKMTLDEIIDAALDGQIDDGKTVVCAFLIKERKTRGLLEADKTL